MITTLLTLLFSLGLYIFFSHAWSFLDWHDDTLGQIRQSILVVICFLLSRLLIKVCKIFLWQGLFINKGVPMVTSLIVSVFNFVVYFVTAIIIVKIIYKTDVVEIMLASGVLAIILGYGAQFTLSNIFSGIALNIVRNVMPGDYVKIDGFSGQVINLDWRAITIEDFDCNKLVIPNSLFAKKAYVNFRSKTDYRRVKIEIKMPYSIRPGEASEILLSSAKGCLKVLSTPPPLVHLVSYEDTGMIFVLEVYTLTPYSMGIKNSILTSIYYKLMRINKNVSPVFQYHNQMIDTNVEIVGRDVFQTLQQLSLYQQLDKESQDTIQKNIEDECYGPLEVIVEPGWVNSKLRILHRGQLQVFHVNKRQEEKLLATLERGAVIGEFGVLLKETSKYRVRAIGEVVLLSISRDTFREIVKDKPEVVSVLHRIIEQRKQENRSKLTSYERDELRSKEEQENNGILKRLKDILNS